MVHSSSILRKTSSQTRLSFSTLDVFTATPFKGNQLAVVQVPASLSLLQDAKQAIARESNFSETVFLHEATPGSSQHGLDIFTPEQELPFAGHPVIGTICKICQYVNPPLNSVVLLTKAGPIRGVYDGENKRAEAKIPHNVRIHKASVPGNVVLECQPHLMKLSASAMEVLLVSIVKGLTFLLVNLPSLTSHLEKLDPGCQVRIRHLINLDHGWAPSFTGIYYYVIISDKNQDITRIRTRMFEPGIGEDPVTGSAACTLAAFLALKDGRAKRTYRYAIEQGVEMDRAGEVHIRVILDGSGKAVEKLYLGANYLLILSLIVTFPEL